MAADPTKQRRQGTIPGNSRLFNLRLVLDMVRLQGPISRADLARRTNLTKQTVGIIADDLCQAGLLREEGRKTGGIGKPSMQLALNAEGAFTVGLHLDRDQLIGILCDLTGQLRLRRQYETPTRSPEIAAGLLRDLVSEILADWVSMRGWSWASDWSCPAPSASSRWAPRASRAGTAPLWRGP